MPSSSDTSSPSSRIQRAWKDAWLSFRVLAWTKLGEPGWCWLSRVLQMYEGQEPDVLRALQTEFDDLSWWDDWKAWNDRYEHLLPTADDLRHACPSFPLPSELPVPPDEPADVWDRAEELWGSDDRLLAIGGATIRTVLARGRATREIQGA